MKTYKCKVRCQANPNDEVRKKDVTAAEIRLLRLIHGEDAVVEIVETGETDRDINQERDRLEMRYAEKAVLALFGPKTQAIADEIETELKPQPKDDEKPLPVAQRTRVSRAPQGIEALTA